MGNDKSTQQPQLTTKEIMVVIEKRLYELINNQHITAFSHQNYNVSSIKHIVQKFKSSSVNDEEDRIFGCLFGCLIGDALGAYCEFNTRKIDDVTLNKAMLMKGGGVFKLRSGQFTDDSEMSYHLLKGLLTIDPNLQLHTQEQHLLISIANQYIKWLNSMPFDVGNTCKNGIQILIKNLQSQNIERILSQVSKINNKSQSNGSLMRITPMALFFRLTEEKPQEHMQFIKSQIALLHPNQNLTQAGYIWVVILSHLIARKDNSTKTFTAILQHAQNINENSEIKKWFIKAKENHKMVATTNMGWAKIAWTYGISILFRLSKQEDYFLSLKFMDEIKSVIKQAGDSDTNACIVGGMIGAIIGFGKLPKRYLQKLMRLSFPQNNDKKYMNDRPKQYEPFNVFVTLADFIQKCTKYKDNKKKTPLNNKNQIPGKPTKIEQKVI